MTKTIMVVDDKAGVTRLMQDYLSEQGFRVVVATNGREALYVALDQPSPLIPLPARERVRSRPLIGSSRASR